MGEKKRRGTATQRAKDEAILKDLVRFTALSFATATPVPFGAALVETHRHLVLSRTERGDAGKRSERTCRDAGGSKGVQETWKAVARGIYALQHLRTVSDVYGECTVGRSGSSGLWGNHRRC
jgi:hypothetical protein